MISKAKAWVEALRESQKAQRLAAAAADRTEREYPRFQRPGSSRRAHVTNSGHLYIEESPNSPRNVTIYDEVEALELARWIIATFGIQEAPPTAFEAEALPTPREWNICFAPDRAPIVNEWHGAAVTEQCSGCVRVREVPKP